MGGIEQLSLLPNSYLRSTQVCLQCITLLENYRFHTKAQPRFLILAQGHLCKPSGWYQSLMYFLYIVFFDVRRGEFVGLLVWLLYFLPLNISQHPSKAGSSCLLLPRPWRGSGAAASLHTYGLESSVLQRTDLGSEVMFMPHLQGHCTLYFTMSCKGGAGQITIITAV